MLRPLIAALCLAMPLSAQQAVPTQVREQPRPVLRATPLQGDVRIDGKLDEQAWTAAEAYSDFRQLDPNEGQPGSERTELRVLYDDRAIYLGLRMFDSDAPGIRSA